MKLKTIRTILSHPLNKNKKISALITFFRRGLAIRIHPYAMVYPFVENISLIVEKGMSSAELQVYTGLYDTNEMLFIMHFLRGEDTFVDVGANIGVYTVLASGIAGANSIAYEPIPSTFGNMVRNINYNNLQAKAELINCGVGDKKDKIVFSNSLDAINHVIFEENFKGETIEIPVDSLDNMLAGKEIHVLKIDVEGYEANVINGASKTLENPKLNVVIMETNGLTDQYEFDKNYLHDRLVNFGFSPYDYFPKERRLEIISGTNPENTIYIRDIAFVRKRVENARKIKIQDKMI